MKTRGNTYSILPAVVSLACLLIFLMVWADKKDTIIRGDGKGYYTYLPALFIYHDLSFGFYPEIEKKYYPDASLKKDFQNEVDSGRVNKYFAGVTILWLPFFLVAHLLSLLFGFPADGYSLLYQVFIGSASSVYLALGVYWALRLLESFGIGVRQSAFAVLLFVFGTNLFHYTVYDPTLTHSINFSLIAGFLYYARSSTLSPNAWHLVRAAALLGLIVAVRLQNILIIIPALALLSWRPSIRETLSGLLKPFPVLIAILLAGIPMLYQSILWKKQGGSWFTDSYSGEKFDLSNPHIPKILFSFEKGWFLYTPLALLSFFGLVVLYRQAKFSAITLLIFFTGLVYLFSCWWIWTYGYSFGQRVFVDYYPVLILLLAMLLTALSGISRTVILSLSVIFVLINQMQSWQHFNGILPGLGVDREIYFDSFFRFSPESSFNLPETETIIEKNQYYWQEGNTFTRSGPKNSPASVALHPANPFGPTASIKLKPTERYFVQVDLKISCDGACKGSRLILEGKQGSKQFFYQPVFLGDFLSESLSNQSFGQELPAGADELTVYLWNPDTDERLLLDEMQITLYRVAAKQD